VNPSEQPHILLVEDDPGDAGLVRIHLRRAGVHDGAPDRLIWARSLAEALARAQHFKPDVVLLDLSLPDSTGLPTLETLRAALLTTPIIVLTSHDDADFALQALCAGAQDYLVKGSFDHDALGRAIRYSLARGQLESRLRLLDVALNAAANGIVITDPEACIEWANPAFTQLTGYALDEALGHKPQELVKSGWTPATLYQDQALWQTIRAGQVWHGELINRRKDGSFYDEELTITPVTDNQGAIQHFVAIKQDITERKRIQEALCEAEQRWYRALDGSGLGVWDWNAATNQVFFFPQWKAMLGYDERDIGNGLEEWETRVHPDDLADCKQNMQHHFSGGTPSYRNEHRMRCKDGSYKWILDRGMVFEWTKDHQPLRVVGTYTDISERKQAEERLRLLAGVFANTHESIVIINVEGVILDVNPAFCAMTGYPRQNLLGKSIQYAGWMTCYAPAEVSDQGAGLKPSLRKPEFYAALWEAMARDGYWKGEVWNRRKNGEFYPALLTLSAVRDDQGLMQQYIGIAADITLLKQHERELDRMAHYDALTGLPNRLLLADRMQQAIAQAKRNGKRLAVGYLDLDGFKPVNDQYGHDAGDALLIEIARRLEKAVREMDTVARLGGDEFVVLLLELAQVQECEVILNRILKSLRQPIRLGPETVTVGVSIGVCLYPGSGSDDPDGLLRYADRLCTGPSRPARIAIASGIPRFQRVRHERSAFRSGCRHLPAQCRRSAAVYCGQPE
jgi:diguanylate cyclase (GGDEF)-like protein/PAS domain S-box-containing protein